MTQSSQGGPYSILIDETYEIIEEEYEKGNIDIGGGVPSSVIADRTGFRRGSIADHVRPLVESGRLKRVWGIGGESNRPRRSYVPTEGER